MAHRRVAMLLGMIFATGNSVWGAPHDIDGVDKVACADTVPAIPVDPKASPSPARFGSTIAATGVGLVSLHAAGAAPQDREGPPPRLRSGDARLVALIARGARESQTFRSLMAAIEATDGIVYVEPGVCPRGVRACLRMSVQVSLSNRLLQITIDKRNDKSDVELIGSMGHELQHAIEGLSERAVTNGDRLYNFFRRYAPTDGGRFETVAAVNTGDAIRNELRETERAARPGSVRPAR